jgi:protein phosphatase
MLLTIPDPSLVLLIGPSGSGKSTFARRHFRPTEILSSDFFRGLVCDDEASQAATADAFEVLHLILSKRLANRRLTVVDATNVQTEPRRKLLEMARRYHVLPVAIVLDLPEEVCRRHNEQRPGRSVVPPVIRLHRQQLQQTLAALAHEHFHSVYPLTSQEDVAAARIERVPLPWDRRGDPGPFDIIGDVHGCFGELTALLGLLGYEVSARADTSGGLGYAVRPPAGRRVLFVGDLTDRGPDSPEVLRLAMDMVDAGTALCVAGNHDDKLYRHLKGNKVKVSHGLGETLEQLGREPPAFVARVRAFLEGLPSHLVLDGGRLVVAHAGLREDLQGGVSKRVDAFALYGDTSGETDEFGLPVRGDWGAAYRGRAAVVYGHTPVAEPRWVKDTINIDTGCVFGGRLTALRWPERELLSVPAARQYCEPRRAFLSDREEAPDGPPEEPAALPSPAPAGQQPVDAEQHDHQGGPAEPRP